MSDKYFLVQNLMYNAKHVVKRRWYHRIFGEPELTLDTVDASSEVSAKAKFKLKGHHFGLAH